MSYLDILCLAIFVGFAFYGYFKGFFTQIMGLLGMLLAYFCAGLFAPGVLHFVNKLIALPEVFAYRLALGLSGLGIFLMVSFLSKIILKYMINSVSLTKYVNRLMGIFFGLGKGMCVVYLLYVLISWHPDAKNIYQNTEIMAWIDQSTLQSHIVGPEMKKHTQPLQQENRRSELHEKPKQHDPLDALLSELESPKT